MAIENYVARNRELRDLGWELTDSDWDSIIMVTSWLKAFRSATTQMSTTKQTMLSTTHAVFRGLQDQIKENVLNLPDNVSPLLRYGLLSAHRKLSDYYYKFDESNYYTWAARK